MTRNSASAIEYATTRRFLLHQATRLPTTKVQYPEVDRLPSREQYSIQLVGFLV